MIKKADILLGIILLVFCTAASIFIAGGSVDGSIVTVKIDDTLYGTYELTLDQRVEIDQDGHHNVISIKDGAVTMTQSDCKNQVCVEQGAIHKSKQVIVCLPNHVIVSIEGGDDNSMDSIAY